MENSFRGKTNTYKNEGILPEVFEIFARDDAVGYRCRLKASKFETYEMAGGGPLIFREDQTTVGGVPRRVIYEKHVLQVYNAIMGAAIGDVEAQKGAPPATINSPSPHCHGNHFGDTRVRPIEQEDHEEDNDTDIPPPAPMRDRDVLALKRAESAARVARANAKSNGILPRRVVAKMTRPAPPRRLSPRIRILLERVGSVTPSPPHAPMETLIRHEKENDHLLANVEQSAETPGDDFKTSRKGKTSEKRALSVDNQHNTVSAWALTQSSSGLPRARKRILDESTFLQPPPKEKKISENSDHTSRGGGSKSKKYRCGFKAMTQSDRGMNFLLYAVEDNSHNVKLMAARDNNGEAWVQFMKDGVCREQPHNIVEMSFAPALPGRVIQQVTGGICDVTEGPLPVITVPPVGDALWDSAALLSEEISALIVARPTMKTKWCENVGSLESSINGGVVGRMSGDLFANLSWSGSGVKIGDSDASVTSEQ